MGSSGDAAIVGATGGSDILDLGRISCTGGWRSCLSEQPIKPPRSAENIKYALHIMFADLTAVPLAFERRPDVTTFVDVHTRNPH